MPKEIYIDENGNERILSSSPSALSGLLDTDITTPSANQVLAYDGSKWVNIDLPDWTYCGEYNLGHSGSVNTGTWTLLQSLANRKEVLFLIRLTGGSIGNMPRWSLYMPLSVFDTTSAFPDYTVGTARTYVQLDKASDTSITVSNTTTGIAADVYIKLYAR